MEGTRLEMIYKLMTPQAVAERRLKRQVFTTWQKANTAKGLERLALLEHAQNLIKKGHKNNFKMEVF